MAFVLGCDLGTQSLKVVLVSFEGQVVGEACAEYGVNFPHPTWAEQAPAVWVGALAQAVAELRVRTGVRSSEVRALAIAAQVDGAVVVDRAGEPLHDALLWMDRRATAECASVAAKADPAGIRAITGLNLDPSHVAPKLAWLRAHAPQLMARASHALLPGSYLAHHLTGELGVDPSNASSSLLLDVRTRQWSDELCALFGQDARQLAPVRPAHEVLGGLRPAAAALLGLDIGTPVLVGCGDEHAACLGAGVLEPGLVCDIAGTAEPVCVVSREPVFDPSGLVETHCHADPDSWLLENPGFVSGANYRWFRDEFGGQEVQQARERRVSPYEVLNEVAESVPAGAEGLLLLPCLMGAMTPTWNPDARGTFLGFTLAHRRPHFLRALLEASAYAVRDITDRMNELGLSPREIRAVGGGARGRLWRQIKADVTGLPVSVPREVETTALGAAMLALVGAGACRDLAEAATRVVRLGEVVEPRPTEQVRYQDCYGLYRAAYTALEPVFAQAAALARPASAALEVTP